ncbi:MAG: family transcriptional regulator [Pseudonocardiales bacterium]|nr:family transcriptional regulator [Pseudonocardiales bacterium]
MTGLRVRLLGRPRVEGGEGGAGKPHPQIRGQKSWAVLARIALADRPLARSEVARDLFGNADDPLGALRWTLADLRRGLGRPNVLRGDPLALPLVELWLDVLALEDATVTDAQLCLPLLEGIDLRDSPDFELWLLTVRSRYELNCQEELRTRALRSLAIGDSPAAVRSAEAAVTLNRFDESAQELLLRALVADNRAGLAQARLAAYEGDCAREGIVVSPALRAAARDRRAAPTTGLHAANVARSLLQAGSAALDAGAVDGGIETLRRAADDAARAGEPALTAEVLLALGVALVHAVRGFDGEGAVVLHRALVAARAASAPALTADILRELAFIDVQAGRHTSAARELEKADRESADLDDPQLRSALLGLDGMNQADCGRHEQAIELLERSAEIADGVGRRQQRTWSLGVLSRSLLLNGQTKRARGAAEASIEGARIQRWSAFLPFPQAMRAECLIAEGLWDEARVEAEQSFALGCELGDPCWEGMAARAISVIAAQEGDFDSAWNWVLEARQRSDRVADRYVWVSCYAGLAQLELAAQCRPELVGELARRLERDANRFDLPEFTAWGLVHQAGAGAGGGGDGDPGLVRRARAAARLVDNPDLKARAEALVPGGG